MKKIISLLTLGILLTAYSNSASAQYYFYNDDYYDNPLIFEVGASVGAMNSLTDIGGNKGIGKRFVKDLNMGKTSFCGGVFVSMMYKNAAALRLEGTFGKISGNDNVLEKVAPTDIAKTRYNRNLNFRSNITEFSLLLELHPLYIFVNYEERESDPPKLSPYLLGGVGYYSFNPQANLNGRWIDLQPLSTEGEGLTKGTYGREGTSQYKLQQINFPLGLGIKYELSPLINLRGEYIYRVTNTDYLDDVSTNYVNPQIFIDNGFTGTKLANAQELSDRQIVSSTGPGGKRGSPKQKDAFFSFNLKLSIAIGRQKIR